MSIQGVRRQSQAATGTVRRASDRQAPAGLIAAIRSTISCWIARSSQRQALHDIAAHNDRHLLRDIGVSREEAFREAKKWFWRR
jgi:uncharacterized protein YjiS (DUF1127 family)